MSVTEFLNLPAIEDCDPLQGWQFQQDIESVLDALSSLGDKWDTNHFATLPLKSFARSTNIGTTDEAWKSRVVNALQYHSDLEDIQYAVHRSRAHGDRLFVRWRSRDEDTEAATTPILQPVTGTDMLAICAMVEGGPAGVHSLTGQPKQNIESWRKSGITSKREDARQQFLSSIVLPHLNTGTRLIKEPLQIDRWLRVAVTERADRLIRYDAMLSIAEAPEPTSEPEQAPEPESNENEGAVMEVATEKLCVVCKKNPLSGDAVICRQCSISLVQQSGVGEIVIASPKHGGNWRSPAERVVAENAAEIGLNQDVYCEIAGAMHHVWSHIEHFEKIGIFVDGYNLEYVPKQEPDHDDVSVEPSRKGYVRVLGKWVLNPNRLVDSAQKLQSKLASVASPLQRLLTDLQDVEGGRDLRAAIGSHATVQDLMEAGSLTYYLQYLVNDLMGQLTPDTSSDG